MSGRKTTYDLEELTNYHGWYWEHEDAKKNWNCEFSFDNGDWSPTKDTKVVHLHFADKQSRDNYLKSNDHPLENLILKYIGQLHSGYMGLITIGIIGYTMIIVLLR